MSLDLTPVHRNLHTKVTFLGLEFEDLILVLALAAVMNLLAHFVSGNAHVFGIPLNVFMELIVPALAVPFLILFKYGKPRGYIADLTRSFVYQYVWSLSLRVLSLLGPLLRMDQRSFNLCIRCTGIPMTTF